MHSKSNSPRRSFLFLFFVWASLSTSCLYSGPFHPLFFFSFPLFSLPFFFRPSSLPSYPSCLSKSTLSPPCSALRASRLILLPSTHTQYPPLPISPSANSLGSARGWSSMFCPFHPVSSRISCLPSLLPTLLLVSPPFLVHTTQLQFTRKPR